MLLLLLLLLRWQLFFYLAKRVACAPFTCNGRARLISSPCLPALCRSLMPLQIPSSRTAPMMAKSPFPAPPASWIAFGLCIVRARARVCVCACVRVCVCVRTHMHCISHLFWGLWRFLCRSSMRRANRGAVSLCSSHTCTDRQTDRLIDRHAPRHSHSGTGTHARTETQTWTHSHT